MSDIPLSLEAIRQLLTPLSCTDTCYEIAHTWTPSCFEGCFSIFRSIMRESLKIYPPLYLVAAILRKEKFEYFTQRFFLDVLQSALAIAVNGSFFVGWVCVVRKCLGKFYFLSMGLLPGFLASVMGINVERKERRGILSLYMFNLAIEMIYNVLKKRGYIIPVPYGEVWILCVTSAIMMYLYRSEDGLRRGALKSLIRFFVGSQGPENVKGIKNNQNVPPQICNRIQYQLSLDCIKQSLKAFTVGFVLQLLPQLPKAFRTPSNFPQSLYSPDNFKCGLFLGSYVGIFKVVEYLLAVYRKRQDNLNALIAGGLSGLSMMFYRSSTIALYLASKIGEIMYKRGVRQGILPTIPHATIWVYSISTALIFHSASFEVDTVRPSYWKYLNQVTGKRFFKMNRQRLAQVFGAKSLKIY
ncbi:transmembrane protein 135-like isoform X2 [Actinia tenebrosa]|uniref:Transmembrane protein 135-like isoform X2 n=1 Tax=Actinia tenebrosa TaxID=6105 RepID=A0A6P8IVE8_ACTTE|nr:transmembrane protein 135-like isoform X2 [Actinia tenebrosa]